MAGQLKRARSQRVAQLPRGGSADTERALLVQIDYHTDAAGREYAAVVVRDHARSGEASKLVLEPGEAAALGAALRRAHAIVANQPTDNTDNDRASATNARRASPGAGPSKPSL